MLFGRAMPTAKIQLHNENGHLEGGRIENN